MATSSTEDLAISDWTKLTVIGRGSFGSVFLGIPTKPNLTCVAIKVAPCQQASSIFNEKIILESFVGRPEIVQCIGDAITDEGNSYFYNLILEYAAGGTLADLIKQKNKLPEKEVKEYLRMILRGLSCIHGKGFVHSDIKPNNILAFPVGNDGRMKLKIADFGLSKRYNNKVQKEYNGCKLRFRATPRYMSPESMSGEIKPPLDIWSLGCVFINMVTGKRMWNECKDHEELISKLVKEKKIPKIPKELSRQGKDFLRKCFERNPKRRWSADMLLRHPYLAEEEEETARNLKPISTRLWALCEDLRRFFLFFFIF